MVGWEYVFGVSDGFSAVVSEKALYSRISSLDIVREMTTFALCLLQSSFLAAHP